MPYFLTVLLQGLQNIRQVGHGITRVEALLIDPLNQDSGVRQTSGMYGPRLAGSNSTRGTN